MTQSIAEQVVAEARDWIGTPYVHQASAKGAGSDCLGLLRGVWRAVLGAEPEAVPAYTKDWSEAVRDEQLWAAASRHLRTKPKQDVAIGDVLLFRMRTGAVAKHLGLQVSPTTFVHAYTGHGVLESSLSLPWQRRLVARFEFPEKEV